MKYPQTPDGRYFVAKERLWRKSDPQLDEKTRQKLVRQLMDARRAVKDAKTEDETRAARDRVHDAKVALGKRGPVWWDDGAPDETRKHPRNTRYADWWKAVSEGGEEG